MSASNDCTLRLHTGVPTLRRGTCAQRLADNPAGHGTSAGVASGAAASRDCRAGWCRAGRRRACQAPSWHGELRSLAGSAVTHHAPGHSACHAGTAASAADARSALCAVHARSGRWCHHWSPCACSVRHASASWRQRGAIQCTAGAAAAAALALASRRGRWRMCSATWFACARAACMCANDARQGCARVCIQRAQRNHPAHKPGGGG